MIVNAGYPKRMDYFTHVGDSFRCYFLLENLDETPFDATGYSFDFVNRKGSQPPYGYSKYGLTALTTSEGQVYVAVEFEKDILIRQGVLDNYFHATKAGVKHTPLTGKFVVSRLEDPYPLDIDVREIDSPGLRIRITVLLEPPTGEVVEPPDEQSTYFASDYVENPTNYVLN